MTFGIVFGTRVSADALAVIVGVVLGILAGIPTTLLAIFIMTRQRSGLSSGSPQAMGQPPVVVINAADRTAMTSPPPLSLPYTTEPTRRWTVIGDVETES
ncbi:MAG: hypothetical protein HC875_35300 [Anaerolineales bacterium]|nr:hypothetical protein [Anaerolineales bacterium]